MRVQRVYVETTIPSAYINDRSDPEMIARKTWTRQWWDSRFGRYELVTSAAVISELSAGKSDLVKARLELIAELPLLSIDAEILEIVQAYIKHRVMPSDPAGDALHLAVASFYKCDFLVTWNCRHLANANKFGHIRRVNAILGLFVPTLVTPLELIGDRDESDAG